MPISESEAAELIGQARQHKLHVSFHRANTANGCIVELEFRSGATLVATESWYNSDGVGPTHLGTSRAELTEPEAIKWLVGLVETPYETYLA